MVLARSMPRHRLPPPGTRLASRPFLFPRARAGARGMAAADRLWGGLPRADPAGLACWTLCWNRSLASVPGGGRGWGGEIGGVILGEAKATCGADVEAVRLAQCHDRKGPVIVRKAGTHCGTIHAALLPQVHVPLQPRASASLENDPGEVINYFNLPDNPS